MPNICFYFQVHQPFRVGHYRRLDSGRILGVSTTNSKTNNIRPTTNNNHYFDHKKNKEIAEKVAQKCYLPMNTLLLELIERYEGKFKVAFSITGVALEQMEMYTPTVLDSFIALADTGCVEFLGETYYHSLAALYSEREFKYQVRLHTELMQRLFNYTPQVFRNTELIYDNSIGQNVADLGFKAVIAEGVDDILGWQSPDFLYAVKDRPNTALFLKNYKLSDDIAFRFSNRGWNEWPLTAEKYTSWIHQLNGSAEIVNLFMDYETFGEHQWVDTGIFDFFRALPDNIFKNPDWGFCTPSDAIKMHQPKAEISFNRLTSWADMERDLTAWRGNHMQNKALKEIYALESSIKQIGDAMLLDDWRKLLTSDHFYYMCTKWFADGDVHAYFSPFESPYDAFIYYMNIVKDMQKRVAEELISPELPEMITLDKEH